MVEIQARGATLRTRKHFYRPPFRVRPFLSATTKRSSEILSSRGVAGITGLPIYPRCRAHPSRRSPRAQPRLSCAAGRAKPAGDTSRALRLQTSAKHCCCPELSRASLPAGPAYLSAPARPERAAAEQGGGGGAQQQPQQRGGSQQGGQSLQRVRPELQPYGPQTARRRRHRTGPGPRRGEGRA